jgi:hypothetical protein
MGQALPVASLVHVASLVLAKDRSAARIFTKGSFLEAQSQLFCPRLDHVGCVKPVGQMKIYPPQDLEIGIVATPRSTGRLSI